MGACLQGTKVASMGKDEGEGYVEEEVLVSHYIN